VAVVDVSRLKKGTFEARAWLTTVERSRSELEKDAAAAPQQVPLEKR
jgi:hypothetical protein